MRLVATSDTHYTVDTSFIPDGDVFVHAGDFMTSGYPDEWKTLLEWLGDLPHKRKIYVPGNHDFHLLNYPGPALQDLTKIGVKCIGLPGNDNFLHTTLPNNMKLLGLPFVMGLPRWAFNVSEEYLVKYFKKLQHQKYDIIVSHSPMKGVLDEVSVGNNVGIGLYWDLFKTKSPNYWICGHIHESYGHVKINDCYFYNVAMCDRNYNHTNPPIIIDI